VPTAEPALTETAGGSARLDDMVDPLGFGAARDYERPGPGAGPVVHPGLPRTGSGAHNFTAASIVTRRAGLGVSRADAPFAPLVAWLSAGIGLLQRTWKRS
jgi:hypothetical protein